MLKDNLNVSNLNLLQFEYDNGISNTYADESSRFCLLQNSIPETARYCIADRVYCMKRIYFLSTQVRTACEKLKLIL